MESPSPTRGRRFRLRTLFLLVAIMALNLAAARSLLAADQNFFNGLVLIGVSVQAAIDQALRSRGRGRVFWVSFAAGGGLAALSSVLSIAYRDSWADRLWQSYLDLAMTGLVRSLPASWLAAAERDHGLLGNAVMAMVEYVPQFAIALLSGAAIWGLASIFVAKPRGRRPTSTAAIEPSRSHG